ncbi:MAG: UDP-forming cellulose synthase catalytic subunit [Pseudomonadota bacterium]
MFSSTKIAETPWGAAVSAVIVLAGVLSTAFIVTTTLSVGAQIAFGAAAVIMAAVLSRVNARFARFLLAACTIIVSTRYMYWRMTETLEFATPFQFILGYGMFAAEAYLWVILVTSFFQTLWPRNRKPAPLPADVASWPSVDVFIPTYNEPLDVVRGTVLAAMRIDYPKDKLNIYLLDDGARTPFKRFADEAGVHYIARRDNSHAKAGNLNNALKHSKGDLIAIFDCDHAPTRGFLQLTAGWFLKDRKLAMLQTPHYFYNKDPFEKNLAAGSDIPNEGLLFYGVLQDGNDFWNASFFCGSCAVLRREALEDIGGVAVETVTEDAHTSLKMQRRGWNTGFIRFPLAAGLATTSLADHISQRMRWARGMVQIFRTDNPLLGPGLSIAQRLCYANAMLHFLFPVPRFVLLTAPLAFLLFGQHIIAADAVSILAYSVPHIVIATITACCIQGRFRHPFWAEIYEVALSFHLIRPTLTALIFPSRGKFNVTSKDGGAATRYFDSAVVRVHIGLAALQLFGIAFGLYQTMTGAAAGDEAATIYVNIFWAAISFLFIATAIAAANEERELRVQPRIKSRLPVIVTLASGHALTAETDDISVSGASIACPRSDRWNGEPVTIEIASKSENAVVNAAVMNWTDDRLRVEFRPETIEERADITRAVLGRADAWSEWDNWRAGTVTGSFAAIFKSILAPLTGGVRAAARGAGVAILGGAAVLVASGDVRAETTPAVTSTRSLELELSDFGVPRPLRLNGAGDIRGVGFTVRSDEVVKKAQLAVDLDYARDFDPQAAELEILLNGEVVSKTPIDPDYAATKTVTVDLNPFLFFPDNEIAFRLAPLGDTPTQKCGIEADEKNYVLVSHRSKILIDVDRLPVASDLTNLPNPFFDERDATELSLPFIFADAPSTTVLEGAAAMASYWGAVAAFRGANFPVKIGAAPADNGVVFVKRGAKLPGVEIPAITGPSVAIVDNPTNRSRRLLLVLGRDDEELALAARAFTLKAGELTGERAAFEGALEAAPRKPYDAPNWIDTDERVFLKDLVDGDFIGAGDLRSTLATVNFNLSPDLFVWGRDELSINLGVDHPDAPWINARRSRLDVQMNGQYLASFPFKSGAETVTEAADIFDASSSDNRRRAAIPETILYGQNQLQFFFDVRTSDVLSCADTVEKAASLSEDSYLDLTAAHHFAEMPNLALFAQAGFPFTRMADLSETLVILPEAYSVYDLEALLRVMGVFGAKTGYPALGVDIINERIVAAAENKDVLLIGPVDGPVADKPWSTRAPIEPTGDVVRVRRREERFSLAGAFVAEAQAAPKTDFLSRNAMNGLIAGFRSPISSRRAVVAIVGDDGPGLLRTVEALASPDENPAINRSLAVVSPRGVESFVAGERFYVGDLPPVIMTRWLIAERPSVLAILLVLSIFALGGGFYGLMRTRATALEEGKL